MQGSREITVTQRDTQSHVPIIILPATAEVVFWNASLPPSDEVEVGRLKFCVGVLTHRASSHLECQGDWLYGHKAVWLGLYNGLRPTVSPHDFAAGVAKAWRKASTVSRSQLFSCWLLCWVKICSSTRLVADCKLTKVAAFKNWANIARLRYEMGQFWRAWNSILAPAGWKARARTCNARMRMPYARYTAWQNGVRRWGTTCRKDVSTYCSLTNTLLYT